VEKLKAYHLTESEQDQAAIIFGRFNPPHFGHKAAWDIAASFPIWYVGTNQSTQGPKDPLPFDIKMEAMKTFMPELEDHLVAEQSWFTLASMVYKQHGAVTLHIVTDATDAKIFVPALQKQNGLEGPHGFYKFNDIVWSEAERKSEASKVRQAIKDNNPQDFEKYSGVSANTEVAGHPYFNLVRHYMMPYMQAEIDKEKQKVEREKLKAEKEQQKAEKAAMKQTKTKGPAQELAESNLKELSTELLGKYKKAAGADAKKADAEGDYARGDKRFKGINRATNKQFDNDLKKHGQQSVAEVKQRLDPKCWKGKHKEGTKIKGGIRVNNCVPNEGRIRIGQALEQIYEAKARGTIPTVDKDAIPNLTRYDQLDNSDSYASYRFGVALAPSPDSTDMDRKSAIANSFAMVDYTDADAKIRRGAEKTMGVRPTTSTGKGSNETNDVNKISPIAKLKRNKYGI
jgi:nicotinamide mononucleotide adenylyltransferase